MAARHIALFHPRLVRARVGSLDPDSFRRHRDTLEARLRAGASLRKDLLAWIFVDVLGYEPGKELLVVPGEHAALGIVAGGRIVAPIEIERSARVLDGGSLTSRWLIVCNEREIRLYAKSHGRAAHELFELADLATQAGLLRFVALLGRDALLGDPAVDRSPLAQMLLASERVEHEITERLYAQYGELRARLFAELRRRHSQVSALELARTILDRQLLNAFAEARGLAPPNVVECVELSDELRAELAALGDHDFRDDVSIGVLGHVFERSLVDPAQKASQRKSAGIFYTPAFVSDFVVRETLGRTMAEAWARAGVERAQTESTRATAWQAYRDELRRLRVLDPACGSGALLLAALLALAHEHERVNRALADEPTFSPTENLFGIDQSAESVEIARLSSWLATGDRRIPSSAFDRNIRRGNSVVADPSLDPWAFDWSTMPEGFDVVLGNPPYVRHERLTACKDHLRSGFSQVFDGAADLFVYFFALGLRRLEPGGRLGFLVSNKWLRGGYAERLRELLAHEHTIESIVDFGHAPVFPDADAFPCIITVRKQVPDGDHQVSVAQVPREHLGRDLLACYIETHQFSMPQRTLGKQGWSLDPPAVQVLLAKLRQNGVRLEEYAAVKPYRGVVTGCNEAFLVDRATKEQLCREDPRSAAILKKYLRGQDIARWSPTWRERWMIFTRRGIAIDDYPAVKAHLETHRRRLEPRPRDYDGSDWPGRKQGNYAWYEIQDSIGYHDRFEGPKILYQEIQFHPRYAVDRGNLHANNKVFFIPTDDPWLLAVLNSPAMWWHNWRYLVHMKDEALSPAGDKMLHVPIPRPNAAQVDAVASRVEALVGLADAVSEAEAAMLELLRVEWSIDAPGQALSDCSLLGEGEFVAEVVKRRPRGSPPLSPAALADLRRAYRDHAPSLTNARARVITLEREIATVVHQAYRLDHADHALLRATAPPRMPPGL